MVAFSVYFPNAKGTLEVTLLHCIVKGEEAEVRRRVLNIRQGLAVHTRNREVGQEQGEEGNESDSYR